MYIIYTEGFLVTEHDLDSLCQIGSNQN